MDFYATYSFCKGFLPPSQGPFRRVLRWHEIHNLHLDLLLLSKCGVQVQGICEMDCSYGKFIKQCRRAGASVLGVEWDEHATEHLATRKITVEKERPEQAIFDVIGEFQLIEYPEEPKKFHKYFCEKALVN